MGVFRAKLVVGSDDGGGAGADLHLGLGGVGDGGEVLQVGQAEEEDKGVEGQENEYSAAAEEV